MNGMLWISLFVPSRVSAFSKGQALERASNSRVTRCQPLRTSSSRCRRKRTRILLHSKIYTKINENIEKAIQEVQWQSRTSLESTYKRIDEDLDRVPLDMEKTGNA